MSDCEIFLPARSSGTHIQDLLNQLGEGNSCQTIILNFENVKFYSPGAIVAMLAKGQGWVNQGKSVRLKNFYDCSAFQYLQRLNFFSMCGIELQEGFKRRNPQGRFVPIQKFGRDAERDCARISTQAAECIAPELVDCYEADETGLFDYVQYSISELTNNILDHSQSHGYLSAQFTEYDGIARVGIADCGIGVLASFRDSRSPHWYDGMTDRLAIQKALEPKVSSKSHRLGGWAGDPVNAGVGLTLLKDVCKITGGDFVAVSGTGVVSLRHALDLPKSNAFNGMLCELSFPRAQVTNFFTLLERAKREAGLMSGNSFESNFQ